MRTLVPRVIGQTEATRSAKPTGRPPRPSHPIAREEFLHQLPDDRRDAALAVLQAVDENGFVATASRRSSGAASVPITLPGVSGTPVTLDQEFLWVSLGRYHAVLLDPAANREIRRVILLVSPSTRQINDPKKGEVGIRLDSIGPDGRDDLHGLFGVLKGALSES